MFNASTGINPQSGQLANLGATNTINAGLPRGSYSFAGDGARAGQAFNDELYAGIGSEKYGTLTFGRQRALGADAMLIYDPAGGAYSFSFIGYNGLMAGGGDTQDTRWDSALKYHFVYGPVHFGAMYKFDDGQGGCYSASASWTMVANCTPRTGRTTPPMDSTLAASTAASPPTSSSSMSTRRSAYSTPCSGPRGSVRRPISRPLNSINTHPINGANLISTYDTEYGIVNRQYRCHGWCQIYLEPAKVLWWLRIHPTAEPGEPVGRWRPPPRAVTC